MNLSLYKIFNPELKKLSNIEIQFQWKTKGIYEGLIYSIESFFNKYPYFNHETYKLYNNDLFIIDKIKLMAHWHLNGIYEKRLCSDNHFELLYPEFDIKNKLCIHTESQNIYDIKNSYHFYKSNIPFLNINKPVIINESVVINEPVINESVIINEPVIINELVINEPVINESVIINNIEILALETNFDNNNIEFTKNLDYLENINKNNNNENNLISKIYLPLNDEKETIIIFLPTNNNLCNNFLKKSLSLLNYHDMNIMLFIKDKEILNNINFFNDYEILVNGIIYFQNDDIFKNLLCEEKNINHFGVIHEYSIFNPEYVNDFRKNILFISEQKKK